MKLNQRIKFWVDRDYSANSYDKFCTEPQNSWYDVEYYPEEVSGIIIWNKGVLLAQITYIGKCGKEHRGGVYDISKNGIRKRIEGIAQTLEYYNMSIQQFFDDPATNDLSIFYEIELINQ